MRPFEGLGIVFSIFIWASMIYFSFSLYGNRFCGLYYIQKYSFVCGRYIFLRKNCSLWCFSVNHANADRSMIDPFLFIYWGSYIHVSLDFIRIICYYVVEGKMVFFSSFFFANTLFLNIKTFLTLDSPVSLHSYSGHWCSKGVEGWLYTLPPWGCQTKTPKKLVQVFILTFMIFLVLGIGCLMFVIVSRCAFEICVILS